MPYCTTSIQFTHKDVYAMNKHNIPTWILTILLAFFFLVAGSEKWREAFHIVENYRTMGIGLQIMKIVGTLEIIGAIGLFFKKSSYYSALGLATVTIFMIVSSALFQIWDAAIVAVIVLLLTLFLVHLLKKQLDVL